MVSLLNQQALVIPLLLLNSIPLLESHPKQKQSLGQGVTTNISQTMQMKKLPINQQQQEWIEISIRVSEQLKASA